MPVILGVGGGRRGIGLSKIIGWQLSAKNFKRAPSKMKGKHMRMFGENATVQ